MAGRMGGKRVTQLGLTVVHRSTPSSNLLLVKGAVPGPKNGHRRRCAANGCSKAPLLDASGKKSKDVSLDEAVFGAEVKPHLVHEAVRSEQNAQRAGTAATKSRGLVSGGRAKPWRQKGTGRAAPGHDPRPAVRGRRPRVREDAAHVRPEGEPQGREGRAARRAREPRAATARSPSSTAASFGEPSTKAGRGLVEGAWLATPIVLVAARGEEPAKSFRNLERVAVDRPVASSRSAPSSGRARCSSREAALPLVQGRAQ